MPRFYCQRAMTKKSARFCPAALSSFKKVPQVANSRGHRAAKSLQELRQGRHQERLHLTPVSAWRWKSCSNRRTTLLLPRPLPLSWTLWERTALRWVPDLHAVGGHPVLAEAGSCWLNHASMALLQLWQALSFSLIMHTYSAVGEGMKECSSEVCL